MACSHRRRGRGNYLLGGVNIIGDQTKPSCLVESAAWTSHSDLV